MVSVHNLLCRAVRLPSIRNMGEICIQMWADCLSGQHMLL